MGNVNEGFYFLINTIFNIFAFIVMLRFIMQVTRANFSNPIGDLVIKTTSPILKPLRKVVPAIGGYDAAAVVLVFIVLLIKFFLLTSLAGSGQAMSIPLALLGVLTTAINVLIIAILIMVVLSWVSPGEHALSGVLHSVTSPILNPIRKIIPSTGMDLSPLVATLGLIFLKIILGG